MTWATYRAPVAPFERKEDDAALAAWLDERCGCLTASRMADAMSFLKNGNPSQKRSDYMRDLLAERLTGISTRHYVTPAMQFGLENEADAKLVYMQVTGNKVLPAPFVRHETIENFGCTPDGFIGEDGLLEVKVPTTGTFVDWKIAGVLPPEYVPQMGAQRACNKKRKWTDFFAYDPRIKEEKKRYLLLRYEPTAADLTSIELAATMFLNDLDALWEAFVTA